MISKADQAFLDAVAKLHPNSETIGDLAASKIKFPKLYTETVDKFKDADPGDGSAALIPTGAEQIKSRYPAFMGLFGTAEDKAKLVAEFGEDLVNVLLDVLADDTRKPELKHYDFSSVEGKAAFEARISATYYVRDTIAAQRAFQLQAPTEKENTIKQRMVTLSTAYGDLKLTDVELRSIATTALMRGYTDGSISLSHLIYSETSKTTEGMKAIAAGADAAKLFGIAKSYGWNPGNLLDRIKGTLIGSYGLDTESKDKTQSVESFTQAAKDQAMGLYPHLKAQIQGGSTLDDIFGGYRSITAKLLELPESAVDVSNPVYAQALGNMEKGQMSLADWEIKVKTDPKMRYNETKQANLDAQTIGLSLARMFGKVK